MKTARASELIDAVQRVHSGESVLHPAITVKVARLWASYRNWAKQEFSQQLSLREQEVLQLAAKGFRNKTVADKLARSVRTVEGHFNSIFAKLDVSSRLEAVLYAVSRHIVNIEEENRS